MNKKMLIVLISFIAVFITCVALFCFIVLNNTVVYEEYEDDDSYNLEVSDTILILDGWIGADKVDIKNEPSEYGEAIGHLSFNEKITYKIYNSSWFIIQYNGSDAYVPSKYILEEDAGYSSYEQYVLDKIVGYNSYTITGSSGFKSYMDYRTITSKDSNQYKLQHSYAETGEYGIRMVDGRYCVAVGSHFTTSIGQYFDLILLNGTVIPCILADQKADKDTDSSGITTMHNGCVSEFVVDSYLLNNDVKQYGNMSFCLAEWDSPVIEVKVYNKNFFDEL